MHLRIDRMSGTKPKASPHLLEDYQAQTAENVSLYKNDVRGWKAPVIQTDPLPDTFSASSNYSANDRVIYNSTLYSADGSITASIWDSSEWTQLTVKSLYQVEENSNTHWVVSNNDNNYVKSPVAGELYERVYYTGESEMRCLHNDLVSDPYNHLGSDFYKVGIPAGAAPTATGYGTASSYLAYMYTLTNDYGEESPPSAILEITDWDGVSPSSTNITVTTPTDPGSGYAMSGGDDGNFGTINLYRTAADGVGGAEFLLVKSVTYEDHFDGTPTIVDNVADTALGAACPSEDWDNPSASLRGLISLPNGVFAGYVGNKVFLSEPYIPWAWPSENTYSYEETVVGLGFYGTNVVVLTEGYPHVLYGNNPGAMSKLRLADYLPCYDKRSIVMGDNACFYSSKNGLVRVDGQGARNVTYDMIDPNDWANYDPDGMEASWYFGKYFGYYNPTSGDEIALIIDFREGTVSTVTTNYSTYASFINVNGKMYFCSDNYTDYVSGDVPITVREWEADTVNFTNYTWKSKVFRLPAEVNFVVGRVRLDEDFYDDVVALTAADTAVQDSNYKYFARDWAASTEYPANAIVRPTTANNTGYVYQADAGGGTSDTPTEPTWPTPTVVITLTDLPADQDTVTIDSRVYEFDSNSTPLDGGGDVTVDINGDTTEEEGAIALAAAINSDDSAVVFASVVGAVCTIQPITMGSIYAVTESAANLTLTPAAFVASVVDNDITWTILRPDSDTGTVLTEGLNVMGAIGDTVINEYAVANDDLRTTSNLNITSTVTFNLYVDNALKFTKVVSNNDIFKMPSGYRSRRVELEVIGFVPVKMIEVATSVEELIGYGN